MSCDRGYTTKGAFLRCCCGYGCRRRHRGVARAVDGTISAARFISKRLCGIGFNRIFCHITYSRGFFFGPGFPLGFAAPSDAAADLLDPGLGPGTPFRFVVAGGASVLPSSGTSVVALGAGESADSGVFSASGALMVGVVVGTDGSSLGDDDFDDLEEDFEVT